MTPRAFYGRYAAAAQASERAGVPALFALAQSALETGWGRHAPGNMMFGIKAGPGWLGKKQLLVTREVFADRNQGHRFPKVLAIEPRTGGGFDYRVKDWFRAYDGADESFADHARLLRGNPRYGDCFKTRDPREFARRVSAAGYATDPGYADQLVAIIGELETISRGDAANTGVFALAEKRPSASSASSARTRERESVRERSAPRAPLPPSADAPVPAAQVRSLLFAVHDLIRALLGRKTP